MRTISRRTVLRGMAGAAALAAVPDLASILPVDAAAAPGTKGLVGASVFGTNRVAAGMTFDDLVRRRACLNVQRVYFKLSQFPAGANDPQPVGDLAAAGIKMIISFHPDPALTVTDYEHMRAAIQLLDGISGIEYEVALWHEPNLDPSTFPTATTYHDYVGYYAPAVRSVNPSIPIVYIPAMTEGGTMAFEKAPAYYPGPVLIDRILVDYYGNDHLRGIRLDAIMAVADGAPGGPKPFGLAEWGDSNDKLVGPADFKAYVDYLVGLMTSRLSSGKTNADVIWFDSGGPDNSITTPTDFKIPGFQKVYDALNGLGAGSGRRRRPDPREAVEIAFRIHGADDHVPVTLPADAEPEDGDGARPRAADRFQVCPGKAR